MIKFLSLRCLKKCLDEIIKFITPKLSKLKINQKNPLQFFNIIVLKLEAKFYYDSSIPVFLLQISTQLDKNSKEYG